MKRVVLSIKGMHCNGCEMLITDSLEETGFVRNIEASFKKGIVNLDYDETQISMDRIRRIISNEGYEVLS